MTRILSACFVAALVAAWCGSARADLCEKCRNLMFTDSAGTCCNCGDKTSSAALKLCGRCTAALHRCERCMAPLDANAGPLPSTNPSLNWRHSSDLADTAPSTPTPTPNYTPTPTPNQLGSPGAAPATPAPAPVRAIKRIDPNKSGVYLEGKWKFQLDITSPGTRNEARMGWLFYDGKKPPRGEINDFYRTPWGPIYWVRRPGDAFGAARLDAVSLAPGQPHRARIGPSPGSTPGPGSGPGKTGYAKAAMVSGGQG